MGAQSLVQRVKCVQQRHGLLRGARGAAQVHLRFQEAAPAAEHNTGQTRLSFLHCFPHFLRETARLWQTRARLCNNPYNVVLILVLLCVLVRVWEHAMRDYFENMVCLTCAWHAQLRQTQHVLTICYKYCYEVFSVTHLRSHRQCCTSMCSVACSACACSAAHTPASRRTAVEGAGRRNGRWRRPPASAGGSEGALETSTMGRCMTCHTLSDRLFIGRLFVCCVGCVAYVQSLNITVHVN